MATTIQEIGDMADTMDNLVAATQMKLPAEFHLQQLKGNLIEMSAQIKEYYVAMTGENPWD